MQEPSNRLDKLQRGIFNTLKNKALSLEGERSPELIRYESDQRRFSKRDFHPTTMEHLLKALRGSRVIYLGDFHTFDQSGRNMQRLLRSFKDDLGELALGVEFIHQSKQEIVDQYLAHLITELEFLEGIEYHDSWRFPWSHYKAFFDLAREQGLSILALNTDGNLVERDKNAGRNLARYLKENPSSKLLVLFGELHIVEDKLPREVRRMMNEDVSYCIIHQNLDEVYWRIDHKDIEKDNQILAFNQHEFILMSSPPWIKYESMIYWYENLDNDPDFDIHEYFIETGVMAMSEDVPENFHFLSEKIVETLALEVDPEFLEDFNLYDHQSLDIIEKRLELLPVTGEFFTSLIEQGKSFKLPGSRNYYCSSYSINRISYLAGMHVQSCLAPKADIKLEAEDPVERFLYLCAQTMTAYFCSKIINPYRKCDLYHDISRKALEGDNRQRTALQILQLEEPEGLREALYNLELIDLYYIARIVGFYLSDRFYESLFKLEQNFSRRDLNMVFHQELSTSEFVRILRTLLPKDEMIKQKKRFF